MTHARPAVDRFAEKVALDDDGCLVWIGGTNSHGYGTFNARPESVMAHRWSYEYHVAPIPAGMVLDHICRNRACVNPDHLEPVTQSENLLRGAGVGLASAWKTHCPAGHPYSEANTYLPPRRVNRMCRTCRAKSRRAIAA